MLCLYNSESPRSALLVFTAILLASLTAFVMWPVHLYAVVLGLVNLPTGLSYADSTSNQSTCVHTGSMSTSWHAPNATEINDLDSVLNGSGIYGYIFNSSTTPLQVPYATYNWCNMPHVRSSEYQVPEEDFQLAYVEVIHRHHKRTPYQSNTFPIENVPWSCDDESLYYFGAPADGQTANIAWSIQQSPLNPFKPTGFQNSTCQFPQITAGGLVDSREHGKDLFGVYHSKLGFLPEKFDPKKILYRVTNNVITSQVAGQVAFGMFPDLDLAKLQVIVQPAGVDSLEPQYSCEAATALFATYGVGSDNPTWLMHLEAPETRQLFASLDRVSNVNSSSSAWHNWFDHYFDNLSANLCHDRALPCNTDDPSLCVTTDEAEAVFRRGLYEYSFIYRDDAKSLNASLASYGVWIAEVVYHMKSAMAGEEQVLYRHNVAHDGSISRLLSLLQIDVMVWPGMGSEVVFELWRRKSSQCWYVRVMWKGQPLRSSNPSLGLLDMIPADHFLQYVDELAGPKAARVPGLC